MTFRPALGTEVTFITGDHAGESGFVWDDGSGDSASQLVLVRIFDSEETVPVYPSELAWSRTVPPRGTSVEVVYIASMEGITGKVVGYVNVATTHRIETVLGLHQGTRACLVDTTPSPCGTLPILPENLMWDNTAIDPALPETTPLPPPGKRTGDIDPMQLPNPGKEAASPGPPGQREAEVKRAKSALYQVVLGGSARGEVLVRTHPHPTGGVRKHLSDGAVVSVVLPRGDHTDPPEGWHRMLSGGFFRLPHDAADGLVPLAMGCPCCTERFATEQAAREHFRAAHPEEPYHIVVSGGVRAVPRDSPEEPNFQFALPEKVRARMGCTMPPVTRQREVGQSPAWFNLRRPRPLPSPVEPDGADRHYGSTGQGYRPVGMHGSVARGGGVGGGVLPAGKRHIAPSIRQHHVDIHRRSMG